MILLFAAARQSNRKRRVDFRDYSEENYLEEERDGEKEKNGLFLEEGG